MLVASAAAMFGALSYMARSANELGLSAMPYVVWRAAIGTVTVLLIGQLASLRTTRAGGAAPVWLPRSRRGALIVACLLGATVNIAMFQAFLLTTIALVLIVFYTYPAMVTLGAVVVYGERLTPVRAAALALSGIGLVLVVVSPILGGGSLTVDALGLGLAVLAAVCQASFFLIAGKGFGALPAVRTATYAIAAAGIVAFGLALLGADYAGLALPFSVPEAWIWILAGGVVGAALPTTAVLVGIGIIGPSRAAILMTIEPLVAIVIAAMFLGEQPTLIQVAGGAAVLVAAVILQLTPSRVPPEPEFGPLL